MRTLVMTTGYDAIIVKRWLPNLRNNGEYKGDVLIADYGTVMYGHQKDSNRDILIKELLEQPNVKVIDCDMKLPNIFIDRARVYREYLHENERWKDYDVIMITDSNDIIFWSSIQPLLEMAKSEICVVKEHEMNLLSKWDDFYPREHIMKDFGSIAGERIINGGMVVGPSKDMMYYLDFIYNMDLKYGYDDSQKNTSPCDQVYLGILLYFYDYPHKILDDKWNYTRVILGRKPRECIFKNGQAYSEDGKKRIIIEHRTGSSFQFWRSREGLEIIDYLDPISLTEEYEKHVYMRVDVSKIPTAMIDLDSITYEYSKHATVWTRKTRKKNVSLREDISKYGILEPVIVKRIAIGKYRVTHGGGRHRLSIARDLGIKKIPCKVIRD
jgi:hypothetical protein